MARCKGEFNDPQKRPAIEQFAIDYDIPLSLAVKLVGETEVETSENIRTFIRYLRDVRDKHIDYLSENGFPLLGDFTPEKVKKEVAA